MIRYALCLILILGSHNMANADEFHLVVNGKAIHMDKGNYNEKNWGIGFEYNFTPRNNWITFISASSFKDSTYQTSRYVGAGMKRRYRLENNNDGWHVDAGVIAFLMTRKDFKNNSPFPGILPVLSVGKSWYAMNVTYIPKVSPKYKALFYFQLMFRLAEF